MKHLIALALLLFAAPCCAAESDDLALLVAIKEAELRLATPPAPAPVVPRGPILPLDDETPEPALRDGQLSPRGEWRWNASEWRWEPVAKASPAYPMASNHWTHPGRSKAALINHLMAGKHAAHFSRDELECYSYAQLERIHNADHNSMRGGRRRTASSNCPNGNCPSPSRGGLFGWRR